MQFLHHKLKFVYPPQFQHSNSTKALDKIMDFSSSLLSWTGITDMESSVSALSASERMKTPVIHSSPLAEICLFSFLLTTKSPKHLTNPKLSPLLCFLQQKSLIQKVQTLLFMHLMIWLRLSFSWMDNVCMSIQGYLLALSFPSSSNKCHWCQNKNDYFLLWALKKNHSNQQVNRGNDFKMSILMMNLIVNNPPDLSLENNVDVSKLPRSKNKII